MSFYYEIYAKDYLFSILPLPLSVSIHEMRQPMAIRDSRNRWGKKVNSQVNESLTRLSIKFLVQSGHVSGME